MYNDFKKIIEGYNYLNSDECSKKLMKIFNDKYSGTPVFKPKVRFTIGRQISIYDKVIKL
jgi:hypothetical protein